MKTTIRVSIIVIVAMLLATTPRAQLQFIHPPKLYIDVGHGGESASKFGNNGDGHGALGMNVSLSEQWVNLQVALAVRDSIIANFIFIEGVHFKLSRKDDTTGLSLFDRVSDAVTNFQAEQFVSIHHNGFAPGGTQGTEVWWSW